MDDIADLAVAEKFESYPPVVRKKLLNLRTLILEVAKEDKSIGKLEECLKWGEPAYLAKHGSAVRIGWKAASPGHFCVYFNCKTKLVETFKEIYGDGFSYQSSRAIELDLKDEVPVARLKHCIALSFNYHRLKHLPLLGE